MKTEFPELDNYINIDEPKLILLGGVKEVGKTTFLTNIAANLSLHQNIPVLFFSLEEDYIRADMKELDYFEFTKQIKDLPNNFCIADKIILKESLITTDELRTIRSPYLQLNVETLSEESNLELYDVINNLKQSKLFVKDKMPITINEIIQFIREYVEKENVKFIILDSLKFIQYDKDQIFDEEDELKHSMEILRQLCAVLKVSILVTVDLEYFGTNNFKISDFFEEEYTKMADIFMIMHRENYNIYDKKFFNNNKIVEIYILNQNGYEKDKIELMYNYDTFKYLNIPNKLFKYEKGKYEIRLNKLFDIIENNNVIFLNPNEFEAFDITNIIEEKFKKQNIKYKICDFFENIAIEKMIDNSIDEYIEKFKDVEIVIFVIYMCDITEKVKDFVYEVSKKILNTGTKKKGIYISDFYGITFSSIPEEFGQEDDDVFFF